VSYEVRTEVFEGPFDLLLHLITSEKVDLYEVSISTIVDGYLAELARMERLDLDVATEFVLIAATLVELKCRRLLPGRDDVDVDEEIALWEERDLLLSRLLECKTFKDVADVFSHRMSEASRSLPRRAGPDERFAELAPDILAGVTPVDLREAMRRLSAPPAKPPRVSVEHVAPIGLSVADAVVELSVQLSSAGPVSFRRLTSHLTDRLEVIVHFLAVLELFKRGLVDLEQATMFGELRVEWTGGDEEPDGGSLAAVVGEYQG
jgi:segregation and condensation protein A